MDIRCHLLAAEGILVWHSVESSMVHIQAASGLAGAGLGRVKKQWIQIGKTELGREEMGVGVCQA